jgi:hypothetical protein
LWARAEARAAAMAVDPEDHERSEGSAREMREISCDRPLIASYTRCSCVVHTRFYNGRSLWRFLKPANS